VIRQIALQAHGLLGGAALQRCDLYCGVTGGFSPEGADYLFRSQPRLQIIQNILHVLNPH